MPKDKFNDELTLLEKIRDNFENKLDGVILLTENADEKTIVKKLLSRSNEYAWINSSGKDDPPPDFYSEKFKLMADIMQINDSEKSKKKNTQREADSKSYNDLVQSGILDQFPNLKQIEILNPCQDVETNQHHRYSWYVKSFNRIVNNHKDSIELYRKNHPGYKLIFIIYDDSEPYCQLPSCLMNIEKIKQDGITQGELHLPFLDKEMMKSFKDADIDYVVWFMENKNVKHINSDGICEYLKFPKIVVFNPASVNEEHFKDYYSCRIMSVNW